MNIRKLFPSPWLTPDDLQGRRFELTIASVQIEEMHNRKTNEKEHKPTVAFQRATKRLILNKTQGFAIARILGSDDTDDWPGKCIALRTGKAPNGKPTIVIEAASVPAPAPNLDNGERVATGSARRVMSTEEERRDTERQLDAELYDDGEAA